MKEKQLEEFIQFFIEYGIVDDKINELEENYIVNRLQKGNNNNIPTLEISNKEEPETILAELQESSDSRCINNVVKISNLLVNFPSITISISNRKTPYQINFKNCVFGYVGIGNQKGLSSYKDIAFNFNEVSITHRCIFNGTNCNNIAFSKCKFAVLNTLECKFQKLTLTNCSGSLDLGIFPINIDSYNIAIEEGDFENISIKTLSDSQISLNNVKCKTPIIIDGKYTEHKNRHEVERILFLKSLTINGAITDLRVYNYEIEKLIIQNSVLQNQTIFQNISVGQVNIINLINTGKLIFLNLKPINFCLLDQTSLIKTDCILVVSSMLGNTYFINSELIKYTSTYIYNSDITEIQSINTHWSNNINGRDFPQRKEVYRQLKLVMASSQDKVMELDFHQKEMESYYYSLEGQKDKDWERLNLGLGYYSNRYGNDYIMPIKLYFGHSFFLYFLILITSFYKEIVSVVSYFFSNFRLLPIDWILISKYFTGYFEFLNPTHKINFIEGLNPFSNLIDFISRIIFGFLIYQTITAFRRLYKK